MQNTQIMVGWKHAMMQKYGRAHVSDNGWIWCKVIWNHFSQWPVH